MGQGLHSCTDPLVGDNSPLPLSCPSPGGNGKAALMPRAPVISQHLLGGGGLQEVSWDLRKGQECTLSPPPWQGVGGTGQQLREPVPGARSRRPWPHPCPCSSAPRPAPPPTSECPEEKPASEQQEALSPSPLTHLSLMDLAPGSSEQSLQTPACL